MGWARVESAGRWGLNIQQYRAKKLEQDLRERARFRPSCGVCFQPQLACYCSQILAFDPKIKFVILIHPVEARKRIATGRLSHLVLQDSHLFRGESFGHHLGVNKILADQSFFPVILYPKGLSLNLSQCDDQVLSHLVPPEKKLVVFVIDGSWGTANRMIRESENLSQLPRICFTPERESRFRVRKQPRQGYLSTVEAIHQTIELLGESVGFPLHRRQHDNLIQVFDHLVDQQLALSSQNVSARPTDHK